MKRKLLILLLYPIICFSQTEINSVILGNPDIIGFGTSVAVSKDGTIVAVGAPGTGNDSYVRVYKNENGAWTQIGNEIKNIDILERVGSSVAISDDGTIVAIGARQAGNLDNGHVRVYKNESGVWTQIGNDIIGETSFDEAGRAIALSSDGTIVAIGAPFNDTNGSKSGQVKVFKNNNNNWTQIGVNINGDAAGDEFGGSISLSSDGTIIAIGAHKHVGNLGQVKVFKNENNVWTQLGSDIDGEIAGDYFGYDVSLSNNGLILASFDARGNNANSQKLRVFNFENNTWVVKSNSIDIGKSSSIKGSISVSGNGSIIAYSTETSVTAYEFTNDVLQKKGNSISLGSGFGKEISLSDSGNVLAIGWPTADHSGKNNNGAAKVYDLSSVLNVDTFINETIEIYPNPVKNYLNINVKNINFKNLDVYTLLGKKVLKSNQTQVDLSSLSKGIYLLKINTEKGILSKKIVKK